MYSIVDRLASPRDSEKHQPLHTINHVSSLSEPTPAELAWQDTRSPLPPRISHSCHTRAPNLGPNRKLLPSQLQCPSNTARVTGPQRAMVMARRFIPRLLCPYTHPLRFTEMMPVAGLLTAFVSIASSIWAVMVVVIVAVVCPGVILRTQLVLSISQWWNDVKSR